MVLFGTFEHSLDSKNRLTLPSKVRNDFKSIIMISLGVDGCIEIRSPENFETYFGQIINWGNMKEKARTIQRMISGNTFEVNIDGSNRVLLPELLLKRTNITKDVILVGVRDKIEIWDSKTYAKKQEEQIPLLSDLMEELDNNE